MATPTVSPTSQIANRSGIISSAGTLLAQNLNRSGLIIQNLGTSPLFVCFGAGASTSNFDLILKGAGGSNDGTGGNFSFDVLAYTGIITVAGTSVSCTATEW